MRKLQHLPGILLFAAVVILSSCKKDEPKPPQLYFKTGAAYTSADITVAPGTSITVGVVADEGEDPLHLIYSEVAYDGANVDSLYARHYVEGEVTHAEHDFTFTVRNQTGNERWTFNVNDKDGRLTEKEIRILVQ
jgi:hypothetical protein